MEVALGAFHEEIDRTEEKVDKDLFSKPATTAIEYLRQVQREAALCPDVVVATGFVRNDKDEARNQYKMTRSRLTPAPNDFIPCLAWQQTQASQFAELRQRVNYYKSKQPSAVINSIQLPNSTSEGNWCKFCLGEEKFKEVQKRRGQFCATDDEEKTATSSFEGNEPLLSISTRMSQCTIIDVLEYNVTWLQYIGFSERQGKWLFALLACLEKPLLPNVSSLLRNLARRCADLRASLPEKDDPRLPPLNLIITVVTRYFDQTDLADEP